jgi:hypothetical protein
MIWFKKKKKEIEIRLKMKDERLKKDGAGNFK